MHPIGLPSCEGARTEFLKFAVQLDDLAFIRRARSVENAWRQLERECRWKQDELLAMARTRLAILRALIDRDWSRLESLLARPADLEIVQELDRRWRPALRGRIPASRSQSKVRRALVDLVGSLNHFNRYWERFLRDIDVTPINRLREAYNKYYVIEKACAFASEQIGRDGFEALPAVTWQSLWVEFPPCPVPRLRQ